MPCALLPSAGLKSPLSSTFATTTAGLLQTLPEEKKQEGQGEETWAEIERRRYPVLRTGGARQYRRIQNFKLSP